MAENKKSQVELDDYSKERLGNIATMYGLTAASFFETDPFKVVSMMHATLTLRAQWLTKAYQEFIQVDLSFLKGLLYDLSHS